MASRPNDEFAGFAAAPADDFAGFAEAPTATAAAAPPQRSAYDNLELGLRAVRRGTEFIKDLPFQAVNGAINAVTGSHLATTPFLDQLDAEDVAVGRPVPVTDREKLISSAVEGGAAQAGFAPFAAAAGIPAAIIDVVSGASGGASGETARQAGAGPVGQFLASLAGGAASIAPAVAVERAVSRVAKSLRQVAAETPRAAVLDDAGNLTEHGQEVAARTGATPAQVREAFDAPPDIVAGNDQAVAPQARAASAGEPAPLPEGRNIRTGAELAAGEGYNPETGGFRVDVTARPAAEEASAPASEANTEIAPAVGGEDVPAPVEAADPAIAAERLARANDFGIDMTRGQATKSFEVQDREQRLRNLNGPEAEQMRQFAARQADQVNQAVERFRSAFGDTSLSAEDRGAAVQDAMREMRDNGQRGVNALYRAAREIGQEVPLDTSGIRQAYDRLMVEANVPDAVKAEITQEAARYGIIGKPLPIKGAGGRVTAENGVTTVKLDSGQTVKFYGEPQPLRADNAEEFRKAISALYPADGPRKLTGILKSAIDDAAEQAAEKLAREGGEGANQPAVLKAARDAHKTQAQTFRGKDVVQDIVDWKKGAEDVTGKLKPEDVVKRALASASDLKRVKAVLLSKPTAASKAAWRTLQAHGLATIFEKATTQTGNIAGDVGASIGGAKLRSAIEAFGRDKLKVLLEPQDYNTLMRLRAAIEDVTVPISGTVNHSNSGNLIMRLIGDVETRAQAAFAAAGSIVAGPAGAAFGSSVGEVVGKAVKSGREASANAETLRGVTNYTAERAATDTGKDAPTAAERATTAASRAGRKSARAFIDTYASPRVLAPIIASSAGSDQQ